MPNRAGTIERLALELSRALESMSGLLTPEIVAELGFLLPASIFENPTLVQAFETLSTEIDELPDLSRSLTDAIEADDIAQIIASGVQLTQKLSVVFNAIRQVADVLDNLSSGLPPAEQAALVAFAESFPRKLLDFSVITYLESINKLAVHALVALGLFEWKREGVEFETHQHIRKTIRFDRLPRIISDPVDLYSEIYGWGTPAFDSAHIFETLRNMIEEGTGGTIDIVRLDDPEPIFEAYLFALQRNLTLTPPGLNLEARLPFDNGVIFTEEDAFAFPWVQKLNFQISSATPNLLATVTPPLNIAFSTVNGNVSISLSGDLSTAQATEPFTLIGLTGASRIAARNFGITIGVQGNVEAPAGSVEVNPSLTLRLEEGTVDLDLSEGDSFIQNVTSARQVNSSFNLAASWSLDQGLQLQGSGAVEINLPAHADLGLAKLNNLFFKLTVAEQFVLEASAGITAKLGPLTATITRIGLIANLAFSEGTTGNLGPVDLDFSFKAPSGIGLSVDGGGFKGGGFLEFEPEEARYSGMLELEFQNQFTLKAFGLLNTRLPNGQSGFSLLIIISSEFTPIQLGLGFKLNGVGGLLGLNRTINIDPLRAGLRDNTLSSILFPTDIVANADRIISDLRQIFPPMSGRFVFGPMAKITWGTPTLVSVDLGLIIEIPNPVRLAILGVLRAVLPDVNASILRLQVNFLGEINFERRQLKFDASLFDSKIMGFTLSGDMALRLDFGADKNLLLTIGGFHPAFQPPPMDLPAIRRLSLALLEGDNPRLKLELDFAVTSNTAQFGAKLELYAAAWKFNVYGFLTFDVLFQFNPFYFIAEITAMLALRIGSSSFASIKLSLTLEGPTPWKAQGTASFKICWFFTLKVRFNKTFGESRNTTLPDVAVVPLLKDAFEADDNWESELPPQRHRLESIREELPGQLLVHPVGTLKVSQKVAPLKVRIDRVGSQRPSDAREFQITEVQPDVSPEVVQEAFAPAQFFDMSDEQKLTSASFKQFESGVRIGDAQRLHTGYAAAREVKYELKYIDSQRDQAVVQPRGLFEVDPLAFNTWTLQGAIATSPLSFARNRKSNLAPEAVAVVQEPFAIVHSGDLQLFDEFSMMDSEQAAAARLNAVLEANPNLRGTLQVVPAFELAA